MSIYCCVCKKNVSKKTVTSNSSVCPFCNTYASHYKSSFCFQTPAIKKITFYCLELIKVMKSHNIKYNAINGEVTKKTGRKLNLQNITTTQEAEVVRIALLEVIKNSGKNRSKQIITELEQKKIITQPISNLSTVNIFCCQCQSLKNAVLVKASSMQKIPKDATSETRFWMCSACLNYVGCHNSSQGNIVPLGCISSPEIRQARIHIHAKLDAIWKLGFMQRSDIYDRISSEIGYEYHTGNIASITDARFVYSILNKISNELSQKQQLKIKESIQLTLNNKN